MSFVLEITDESRTVTVGLGQPRSVDLLHCRSVQSQIL